MYDCINKKKNISGIDLELINEILDTQPPITTYVQRTVNEDFGDERLIEAANPACREAEKRCRELIERVKDLDLDLYLELDEAVTCCLVEGERAAGRVQTIAALRLPRREDLLPKVIKQI